MELTGDFIYGWLEVVTREISGFNSAGSKRGGISLSRKAKVIIGAVAILFAIVLAIVIPLSLSEKGERRALALDPTTTAVALPTATALTQPMETPAASVTPTATPRSVPTPDHTPELPAWATGVVTNTETARPSPKVSQAIAFRKTLTEIGELYYQAFAEVIPFEEMADKVYSAMSSEVTGQCTREFFVPEYARVQRDSLGTLPVSKEDLDELRVDLDRFYTDQIAIGISKDGTRAQVDTEISTSYPLLYPFVLENGAWKIRPERLC
ncbi:MAG: hypothetical protein HYW97_00135 [Candidatus Wildermuthbacteria bacterium]|nr:hypothetical protein [Candidatus Wildermuthbacteria bacterium]